MHYNRSMRALSVCVLASAAWVLAGCDVRLTQPDPPESVPRQAQEVVESRGITDQEIGENAERDL